MGGLHSSRRRRFLGCACRGAALAGLGLAGGLPGAMRLAFAAGGPVTDLSPDDALARLKDGNARFVADLPTEGPQDAKRRIELANGQAPFAAIAGCSDSRVPPELLFGRGLGELFVTRVAGNTVGPANLGSLEYAVSVLGVSLIVVLGHERCGAVEAAIDLVAKHVIYPGSLAAMVEPLLPAVLAARDQPGDQLDNAVRENVRREVGQLSQSEPVLLEPLWAGKLRIVGATYDLRQGKVDFLA